MARRLIKEMCAPFASPGGPIALALLLSGLPTAARAAPPLGYLWANGQATHATSPLLWEVLGVSIAVIAMSIVLVLLATFRGRRQPGDALPGRLGVEPGGGGMPWITIGVGASVIVLLATSIWTVVTLAAVSPALSEAKIHLDVIGYQWWWEVVYDGDTPDRTFRTADEIHIPVGEPVAIRLETADVIHAFWVPRLAGKMQLIPGQTNVTWLEADRPGVYRGQCTQYCGVQHAQMALEVVADEPAQFAAWWNHQLAPASDAAQQGAQKFVTKCGACHAVRGTLAGGILGPDLSHLMSRRTIAAAALPNAIGYLSGWIADPQHVKPGSLMPNLALSGADLTDVIQFLETLK